MPATDVIQKLDEAVVTIVNADATMRTLCGRSTGLIAPWQDIGDATLPIIVYQLVVADQVGGLGDARVATMTLGAFSEGNNAKANANALMERLEQLLTYTALATQGLDAAVRRWTRRGIADNLFDTRNVRRADGDCEIWITK